MDKKNITMRKQRQLSSCSSNESILSNYSLDTVKSLPDLSTKYNDENEELLLQIEYLKTELESAHAEIEKISLEKESLYEQIVQQNSKIDRYKRMYVDSMNTPKSTKQSTISKRKLSYNKIKHSKHISANNCNNVSLINFEVDRLTQDGANSSIKCDKKYELKLDGANKSTKNCEHNKLLIDGAYKKCKITNPMNTKRNLFIIGGQQCVDLASNLTSLRENTQYVNYQISGYTKPYANTAEILKICYNLNITNMDRVIICVGENDTNPVILQNELSAILKYLHRTPIILLGVKSSKHLNENKLNSTLKILSHNLKNCTFLNLEYNYNLEYSSYLSFMCKKISFVLDSVDYNRKYLNFNSSFKSNKSIPKPKNKYKVEENKYKNNYKKGTIPYFFDKLKHSQLAGNKSISSSIKPNEYKKGTIPFYFKHQCTQKPSTSQSFCPIYRKVTTT